MPPAKKKVLNKSQAIRDTFQQFGPDTMPKQVVEHLAAKKIEVTSQMVSTIKARMLQSARGGKPHRNGAASDQFVLLAKAKELSQQAGSIAAVRAILERLEALQLGR